MVEESIEGNVRLLEEELKRKDEELNKIKEIYAKKMSDALRMERIKYTGEIEKLRSTLAAAREGGFEDLALKKEELALREKELETKLSEIEKTRSEAEAIKKGAMMATKYAIALQQRKREEDLKDMKEALRMEIEKRMKLEEELVNKEKEFKKMVGYVKKGEADAKVLEFLEKGLKEKSDALEERERKIAAKEEELKKITTTKGEVVDAKIMESIAKEYADKEEKLKQQFKNKEQEYQKKIEENAEIIIALRKELSEAGKLKAKISEMEKERVPTELEKILKRRDEEINVLRQEIEFKDKEIKRLSEPLKFKEEELVRKEEEIKYKEELLEREFKKLDLARKDIAGMDDIALRKRLEELEGRIREKEEELKAREGYLRLKEEELRVKEEALVEEEIMKKAEAREIEFKVEKVKTGNTRLDDLLLGGIPMGTNVLIIGPPFIGKETLVDTFIIDGLVKGIPCIIVTTDASPLEIKEEMKYILPIIDEYERIGLLKYVDVYTRVMGLDEKNENAEYVDHPTDYIKIMDAIEKIVSKFKDKYATYRLVVRSISTFITYSEPAITYRFLQSITGRCKRSKIVALYALDKGMHTETEVQTIGHLMDGSIEMKSEGIKTYLSVQGICEVQSRAWIQYTYSRKWINIGSFTLDHIR
ncbi:MAG: ATPase domain-containing protein [Candidatus Thermoplasmatota archaeon]